MRNISHITPRYARDRLRVMLYEKLNPQHPWLTSDSIELLQTLLRPTDHGFEFGSGRSTRWFGTKVTSLVSVEHHQSWFETVKQQLAADKLSNVDQRFVDLDACDSEEDKVLSYLGPLKERSEASLDFVLVDGLFRCQCAQASIGKLKPTGMLVIDNVNWFLPSGSRAPNSRREKDGPQSDWQDIYSEIRNWRHIWTSNGVSDTAIFFKPVIEK